MTQRRSRALRCPTLTGVASNMRDIRPGHAFISYVHEDLAPTDRLHRALMASGIPVWRDTANLWPGQDWRQEIRSAITADSLAFIACFSANSVLREKSYQYEELILAVEQMRLRPPGRSWLIPVRFSECVLPAYDLGAGRRLASLQVIDLYDGTWETGVSRLISATLRILGGQDIAGHHVERGLALREQHDLDAAEAAFTEALRVDSSLIIARFHLGLVLVDEGRHDAAKEAFREVIRQDPECTAAYGRLGHALRQQGRDREAENAYRAGIRHAPADSDGYRRLGDFLRANGRDREAERAYRDGISLAPDNPALQHALGEVLTRQQRHREAEQVCQRAADLDPDNALLHLSLGNALRRQDRHSDAEAPYREAIRLTRDSAGRADQSISDDVKTVARSYHGLSLTLASLGRHAEAESALGEAIRLSPADPELLHDLGRALFQQGRYAEAEAADRESVRLDPSFGPGYVGLGRDLTRQRRHREAELAYQEAIRLDPADKEAHRSLLRIRDQAAQDH